MTGVETEKLAVIGDIGKSQPTWTRQNHVSHLNGGAHSIYLFISMGYGILVVLLPRIWDTVINFRDIIFLRKQNSEKNKKS